MKIKRIAAIVLVLVVSIHMAGCGNKFFDPTQIGRFRPVPTVNVILDSLGVADETPSTWAAAEEPRPIDIFAYDSDYIFGSGDIVRVSIFELLQEAIPFDQQFIITETGNISIPEVGIVAAAGLTESQLEEEIAQSLKPGKLREPLVTVTLISSVKNRFSISGDGVPFPNRYPIPRYDFRLNEALAIAGGISQFNTSYIYVSRPVTGKEVITEPTEPEIFQPQIRPQKEMPEKDMLEIIAPRSQSHSPENKLVITTAEMITEKELADMALPAGFETPPDNQQQLSDLEKILEKLTGSISRETIDEPIDNEKQGTIEWIFQDGKWVPVQVGKAKPPRPVKTIPRKAVEPLKERVPEDFDWNQLGAAAVQSRVIKIPADKLAGGDPRYNIVIRAGDNIHVPVDLIGEFYIYGNTNLQGAVPLTGRPMTLKQAMSTAGGLGPLAWPKRCEVVRRIGKNKELTVMVDLEKIANGEHPDFFIKPNDWINIGTHYTARWRAVLRNSFRATYGFGFIYDRNFADRDYGTSRPFPNWSLK